MILTAKHTFLGTRKPMEPFKIIYIQPQSGHLGFSKWLPEKLMIFNISASNWPIVLILMAKHTISWTRKTVVQSKHNWPSGHLGFSK